MAMILVVILVWALASLIRASLSKREMLDKVKRGGVEIDGEIYVTRKLTWMERSKGEVTNDQAR